MAPGVEVSVEADIARASRDLTRLQKKDLPKAIVAALNRTVKSVKAASSTEIRNNIALKKRVIDQDLKIKKAHLHRWVATLSAKKRNLPLEMFAPKEKVLKKRNAFGAPLYSISVKTSPKRRRRTSKKLFYGYGKQALLRRVGATRGPLKRAYGPSIYRRFTNPRTWRIMVVKVYERFPREFENQISRIRRRRK